MSSLSSISSTLASSYTASSATQRRQRPDPAEMAADLFAQLDSSGKGYIEQGDLSSALSSLSSGSSSQSASASEIFNEIDGDSDGKVTQDELSTSIKKLADELDSQFDQARMAGAMPPPPPPPSDATSAASGSDSGFSKDELSAQLAEIGSSDSARSTLISKVVENFDQADANGDGRGSMQEAMAYASSSETSAAATSATSATGGTAETTDAQVFRQLIDLLRAYGNGDSAASSAGAVSSLISTSA
jgi:Ca2+-binding EF-hand superfamily protein